MNDLEESVLQHLVVNICKYADDCTLDELVGSGKDSHVQEVLNSMDGWAQENKMSLNPKKTKDMWICFKDSIPEPPQLSIIDGTTVERVNAFKLLGVLHQDNLTIHLRRPWTRAFFRPTSRTVGFSLQLKNSGHVKIFFVAL